MLLNIHCPALNRKSVAQRRTKRKNARYCPVRTKKDLTGKKKQNEGRLKNKGNLGPPMGDKMAFRDDKQP